VTATAPSTTRGETRHKQKTDGKTTEPK
jgi:hypothetical protein